MSVCRTRAVSRLYKLFNVSRILLLTFLTPVAHAVFAGEPLEEVVVTAGFRATALMKSPGSISILDAGIIEDRAARHLDETINTLPNVNFSGGGTRARFIQVRGVGDLEQFVDPKHFPSVGITIDDIEVGTTATGAMLMDVAQIELLRGPQGTRFGANALAGMVSIRTHEPTETFSVNIESGYAGFDSWHAGATVSGPLGDALLGRLAIQQNSSDGYYRNDFLDRDDNNRRDELTLRGKLHWLIGRDTEVNLSAAYADLDGGYDAFSLDNRRRTLSDNPGHDRQETLALALKTSTRLAAGINLETLLSWRDSNDSYAFDEDWVFSGFCDGLRCDPLLEFSSTDTLQRDSDAVALDLRLQSDPAAFAWVAGFYAQQRREDLQRQHVGPFSSDYETHRYALYGQLELELAASWNITAGLRYEFFDDSYRDSNALLSDSSDDYWSGQLSLDHQLGEHTLVYATLSRSVKPGGVNTESSSSLPLVDASFRPFLQSRQQFAAETLFNRELGIKGRYFDERLALRLALFHMDRSNAQLESFVWDASTFIFTGFLDSTSDADNYGAELEIAYQLNSAIDLFANIGYLQTSVDQLTVFDLDSMRFTMRSDREQTKAPRWQYNLGANIEFSDKLHAHLEVEGRDSSYFGYYHDGRLEAYTLAHASLSYQLGKFTLQGFVRNLLDENYKVHGLYFANDPRDAFSVNRAYYQFGEPRVYGVNLGYTF